MEATDAIMKSLPVTNHDQVKPATVEATDAIVKSLPVRNHDQVKPATRCYHEVTTGLALW